MRELGLAWTRHERNDFSHLGLGMGNGPAFSQYWGLGMGIKTIINNIVLGLGMGMKNLNPNFLDWEWE